MKIARLGRQPFAPTRIGEILEVSLARPRLRLELAHDARFMELRAKVLEFLYAKQGTKVKTQASLKVA